MRSARNPRWWAVVGVGVLVLSVGSTMRAGGATTGGGGTPAAVVDPIRHVVVIVQENHTFDNVLGKFCAEVATGRIVRPGRNSHCAGVVRGTTGSGLTVSLAAAPDIVPAVDHSVASQRRDIAGGKMNGFSAERSCAADLAVCYNQYDPLSGPCPTKSCIPNLAALATRYTVSDRTFESYTSPSWAGHMVWANPGQDGFRGDNPSKSAVGPQPTALGPGWGCDSGRVSAWGPSNLLVPSCVPDATGSLGSAWASYTGPRAAYVPTIFDELDAKGLPWRIYGGTGAPQTVSTDFSADGWQWAICPTFAECLNGPQRRNLVPAAQVRVDAAAGTLPAYSVVTPTTADSQHNRDAMSTGDNFIGSTVAAIQAGPDWSSTAIFITYDDCGCFYDHLNPLQYNASWGIRVPMVIVSPFAKLGYTDGAATSFAGTLAFVEHRFGLAALGTADATAYDYRNSFCYQPVLSGCVPAGTATVAMTVQRAPVLTPQQRAAQVRSGQEDT